MCRKVVAAHVKRFGDPAGIADPRKEDRGELGECVRSGGEVEVPDEFVDRDSRVHHHFALSTLPIHIRIAMAFAASGFGHLFFVLVESAISSASRRPAVHHGPLSRVLLLGFCFDAAAHQFFVASVVVIFTCHQEVHCARCRSLRSRTANVETPWSAEQQDHGNLPLHHEGNVDDLEELQLRNFNSFLQSEPSKPP